MLQFHICRSLNSATRNPGAQLKPRSRLSIARPLPPVISVPVETLLGQQARLVYCALRAFTSGAHSQMLAATVSDSGVARSAADPRDPNRGERSGSDAAGGSIQLSPPHVRRRSFVLYHPRRPRACNTKHRYGLRRVFRHRRAPHLGHFTLDLSSLWLERGRPPGIASMRDAVTITCIQLVRARLVIPGTIAPQCSVQSDKKGMIWLIQ